MGACALRRPPPLPALSAPRRVERESSLADCHQNDLDQEVGVGNGIALVIESAPAGHTGSTSSLLGVLPYVFADVTGAALGLAHDGTLAPFVVGLLLCATDGLIAFVVATRVTIDVAPASL